MQSFQPVWAAGLMTGTVLDGNIDVALLKTDGERIVDFGPFGLIPYEASVLEQLQQSQLEARQWQFNGAEPEVFQRATTALTLAQSAAVSSLLKAHKFSSDELAVIGFHGQTVLHRPPSPGTVGQTRQLGDGAAMARQLSIPVVYDFRAADIAAGGQGAPLAAVNHTALLKDLGATGDSAVLNLGGVGNITWWDGRDELVAFDTGPANAPVNDFIVANELGQMDTDGRIAAAGQVDEDRLSRLLQHSYFSQPYPKSLDRFDFTQEMAVGLSVADGAALLTAFSAAAVGCALDLLPQRPIRLIVCGGGRRNPTLMHEISQRANVQAIAAEAVGWRGDATEAECFAFLAVRNMRGLPVSFPGTTGVPSPQTAGVLVAPDQ